MKTIDLKIDSRDELALVAHALSTADRLKILALLNENSFSVNEIAERLKMPLSTTAICIKTLEKAGLILAEVQPGTRGGMKLCSRRIDALSIDLVPGGKADRVKSRVICMPIGAYSECRVTPSCGIVNQNGIVENEDDPRAFYSPSRFTAQILWFTTGYVEYRFPMSIPRGVTVRGLEISLEICSEAPNYRNDWPSDITFWINGLEVGTWKSPGDFGGRRGKLNPEWWSDASTQFGFLKKIRVDSSETSLDSDRISKIGVDDLNLGKEDYISFRIGVKDHAKNVGGVNIFGETFGDYPQNINMRIDYV